MLTETEECNEKLPYSITNDLLETCLNEKQEIPSVLSSFSCHKAAKRSGFLSDIYRLRLNWANNTTQMPSSVILKVRSNRGTLESEVLSDNDQETLKLIQDCFKNIHSNECTFYMRFGAKAPLPIPRCYNSYVDHADGNGYLILEDLADCQAVNPYEGFSLDQLSEIIDHLVRLHCWSLNGATDWRSYFKPVYEFPRYFEYIHKLDIDTLNNLSKSYPNYFPKYDPSIIEAAFDKSRMTVPEGGGVLSHGDLWYHNILFNSVTGKMGGFIDWQFANVGNFVDDLARLFLYNVKTEIRRKNEVDILKRYYDGLKLGLQDSSLIPDFDSLLKMYKVEFAYASFRYVCDFLIFIEECTQHQDDIDDTTKQKNLEELLCRGSSTLNDAEMIIKKICI